MKYIAAGLASTYTIRFKVDGEAVSPDANSVRFTLSDSAGAAIAGYNNLAVTVAPNATLANVSVTNVANTKTLVNELRYCETTFLYLGASYTMRDHYQLRSTLKFPVTCDDIRGALNLSVSEIPDLYIDIFKAYDQVAIAIAPNTIPAVMASGSAQVPDVIEAVKYRAALDIVNIIESVMFQTEQADNTLYGRYDHVDFENMRSITSQYYNAAVMRLNGHPEGLIPKFSIATADTDTITGK